VPIAAAGVTAWLAVRALAQGGDTVTVTFDQSYGLQSDDSKVTLRGVEVGKVSSVALANGAKAVEVKLALDSAVDRYLRSGTRFWLEGAKLSLSNPSSLRGLIAGPTIVMDPGGGKPARHFHGQASPPALPPGPRFGYLVRFDGAAGNLDEGAPVTLRGFRVGSVNSIQLVYDAASERLFTNVRLAIQPSLIYFQGATPDQDGGRVALDDMLRSLVAHGLRARLTQDPPLIGGYQVNLDVVPGAAPQPMSGTGDAAIIPSAPGESVESVLEGANRVVDRLDSVPIAAIGGHLRSAAAQIDQLASSPHLDASIRNLDDALNRIDQTVREAAPQAKQVVAELRDAAAQADKAAAAASKIVAGNPARQNSDLPSALRELTGAARSIRVLADYLERHPEALLKGKQEGK
jgi:paraquat-inducible protein B